MSRDTPEPSPLSHEILNARPYAFLDDAPLEERRTQAVYARRAGEPSAAGDLGALDQIAIDRVRDEQRIEPRDADELHDALLTAGFLTEDEIAGLDSAAASSPDPAAQRRAGSFVKQLTAARRVCRVAGLWVTAERLPELLAVHPGAVAEPAVVPPASRAARTWSRADAIVELLRGRLTVAGADHGRRARRIPVDRNRGGRSRRSSRSNPTAWCSADASPHELPPAQWCDRALLSRIHRYTLNRLRAEIEPVSPADFTRFLFRWQHADPDTRLTGIDGLRAAIAMLDGFEAAAGSWERSILPQRIDRYDPSMLDTLCLAGEVGWARVSSSRNADGETTAMTGMTPVSLFLREHAGAWETLGASDLEAHDQRRRPQGARHAAHARGVVLQGHRGRVRPGRSGRSPGARGAGQRRTGHVGRIRGSAGHRAPSEQRVRPGRTLVGDRRTRKRPGTDAAVQQAAISHGDDAAVEIQARALLRRYGVAFRRLLTREANPAPWRALTRVYRRLEARGEIRGGRFVTGMSGEQFALPEAVERLREVRRTARNGRLIAISAADPLNLAGIIDSGERVRVTAGNRLVYRDGVPLAALEGDYLRPLTEIAGLEPSVAADLASTLAGRRLPAVTSGYVGQVRRSATYLTVTLTWALVQQHWNPPPPSPDESLACTRTM